MLQDYITRFYQSELETSQTRIRFGGVAVHKMPLTFSSRVGSYAIGGTIRTAAALSRSRSKEGDDVLFQTVSSIFLEQPVEQVPAPPLRLPMVCLAPQILPVPVPCRR